MRSGFINVVSLSLVLLITAGMNILSFSERDLMFVLLMYCSFLALQLVYRTLYFKALNLLSIFAASYLIPFYYYHFGGRIITSYAHSNQIYLLNKYLFLYALFLSMVLLSAGSFRNLRNLEIPKLKNPVIFYINIAICLLIALFSKSGESIFSSGGYGLSEIQNIGGFAIGEYFILFFFIAFKFSSNGPWSKFVMISVAVLYILVSFSYGLRNEFIQMTVLLLILFYKEKRTFGVYVVLVFGAIYFSSLFSSFRSNPIEFLQRPLLENVSLKNVFASPDDFYISHQGDVVHSSSRLISFADNKIVSFETRMSSFVGWLSSSIIPWRFLPEEANMAAYLKDQYPAGGGGSPFAYFYFWLSYPGVILIGVVVGLIIRGYVRKIGSLYGVYFVIVIATFPRWLSYSPINFIKMGVYGFVIYTAFVFLNFVCRHWKDSSVSNRVVISE
jgi:hypothetical protein